MVDFHTHILPGMDDGAATVADSLAMLERLRDQGVDTVCLTSHFLKEEPSVEDFLRRRAVAWDALRAALPEKHPRLLLGAEVQYRPGLDKMPGLHRLCLQHTNVLLLEMLFHPWSREEIDTVFRLAEGGEYTVMPARYARRGHDHAPQRLHPRPGHRYPQSGPSGSPHGRGPGPDCPGNGRRRPPRHAPAQRRLPGHVDDLMIL